jgi:hypothetical protein
VEKAKDRQHATAIPGRLLPLERASRCKPRNNSGIVLIVLVLFLVPVLPTGVFAHAIALARAAFI